MLRKKLAKFILGAVMLGVFTSSSLGMGQVVKANQVQLINANVETASGSTENGNATTDTINTESGSETTTPGTGGEGTDKPSTDGGTTTPTPDQGNGGDNNTGGDNNNGGSTTDKYPVVNGVLEFNNDLVTGSGSSTTQASADVKLANIITASKDLGIKTINIDLTKTTTTTKATTDVTGTVQLTQAVVDAIKANVTTANPLTLNFKNGSFEVKTTGLTLDGNGALTITRDTTSTGAVIDAQEDLTISNVTFKDTVSPAKDAFIKTTTNKNVTIQNNTITGILFDTKPAVPATGVTGNIFTPGSQLYVGQNMKMEITKVNIGGNFADARFTVTEGTSTAGITIGKAQLSIIEGTTSTDINIDQPTGTNIINHEFTDLKRNTQYTVKGTAEVVLDGNTYQGITAENKTDFKTLDLGSNVSNIGSSSATVTANGTYTVTATNGLTLKLTPNGQTFNGTSTGTSKLPVDFRLTGLTSYTDYTYEILDGTTVVLKGKFRTASSSTISGGSSSSSSSTTYDIKTTDINKGNIRDITASIPVSNTSLANSMRDGRNFSTNVEGVTVEYRNGNVELVGLVPEKEYKNFHITYTDKNGTSRRVNVATFTTKVSETKLREFICNVYIYSLGRQADERGFAYWENQLSTKVTTPENFVTNLLSEKEFLNLNSTTASRVEALYEVIVARKSDATGLKFWTDKFDALKGNGYTDSLALSSIVNEMVNESEFQARVKSLGL
ncbi:DUF4214 domain-containing protein [Candidatus Arthromitus sp. SFB-rat-Yit]|uniref:DUF4214 domain-containing protein n=1 Tax=Candidatus Arthromitus sp. SFB-rat-Yit TaxID=1041504 RepID=UPI000227A30F|nr:DUF4214 domain-containing protein [Candidatus Arthromitus sp. SFB-rat-Yit]BAK81449.1 hypothetical protein RATSFB_0887 [Candidatus Arthromitus sp. SFB-rat-Yit]